MSKKEPWYVASVIDAYDKEVRGRHPRYVAAVYTTLGNYKELMRAAKPDKFKFIEEKPIQLELFSDTLER